MGKVKLPFRIDWAASIHGERLSPKRVKADLSDAQPAPNNTQSWLIAAPAPVSLKLISLLPLTVKQTPSFAILALDGLLDLVFLPLGKRFLDDREVVYSVNVY